MSQVGEAELQAAIDEAGKLLADLMKPGDPGRAGFVLISAIQLLHALQPPGGRADLELRIRNLLTAVYQTPPASALLAKGAEFVISREPPR